jgi:ubiquinone/menaquinone biosynthesis C-methylase UbiE
MTASYEAKQHYQREDVAAAYDAVRFRGLRGAAVTYLEQRLLMRAMAGVTKGARVLDLPVGTGRMSRRLHNEGYQPVGADVSAPMLRIAGALARDAGQPGVLVRADAERLPFANRSVEVAVCFRLLSHLPPEARKRILREMGRVARDRVIAVYQPHRLSLWWLVYGFLLRRRIPRYFVSHKDLQDEFAASGLRPMSSHALLRGPFMERAYVLRPASPSSS